jgi:hypothetical protein
MEVAFRPGMDVEEAWTASGVYLLTQGDHGRGQVAVPDLELTFAQNGLELRKAGGDAVWNSPWSDIEEMSPVERSALPDGSEAAVVLVVERGRRRRHRFVVGAGTPGPTASGRSGSGGRCCAASTCSSSWWRQPS